MAVEGVGLAPGGSAAPRALDLDEVGALGQRVPLGTWHQVAREEDREVVDRDRDRAALLAVDEGDRRPPGPLARDREVVGAVALGLAGAVEQRDAGRIGGRSPVLGRRALSLVLVDLGTPDPLEPAGDLAV